MSQEYSNIVTVFRSGQMPVRDFVELLKSDLDFSNYYKDLLVKEINQEIPVKGVKRRKKNADNTL